MVEKEVILKTGHYCIVRSETTTFGGSPALLLAIRVSGALSRVSQEILFGHHEVELTDWGMVKLPSITIKFPASSASHAAFDKKVGVALQKLKNQAQRMESEYKKQSTVMKQREREAVDSINRGLGGPHM
jgi:hypothetical protein